MVGKARQRKCESLDECWGTNGFSFSLCFHSGTPFHSTVLPTFNGGSSHPILTSLEMPSETPRGVPPRWLQILPSWQDQPSWSSLGPSVINQWLHSIRMCFSFSLSFYQMYTSPYAKPHYHGCYSFIVNLKSGRNIWVQICPLFPSVAWVI